MVIMISVVLVLLHASPTTFIYILFLITVIVFGHVFLFLIFKLRIFHFFSCKISLGSIYIFGQYASLLTFLVNRYQYYISRNINIAEFHFFLVTFSMSV